MTDNPFAVARKLEASGELTQERWLGLIAEVKASEPELVGAMIQFGAYADLFSSREELATLLTGSAPSAEVHDLPSKLDAHLGKIREIDAHLAQLGDADETADG